ncbi:MAG: hypothetical protein IJI53_12950 [Clostridia bacterium]|nr:hypothetical protein [Clostridia bacterium]
MPAGNITYKTINGKRYPYLQWQENGKQRGRRVKADELEALQAGIVLLETQMARKDAEVFHLQFAVGEFDMVVFHPKAVACEIFEIKHSAEIVPEQTRHLRDEKKCTDTASRFGTIMGKYVIYRGATQDVDGIQYVNVEEYLNTLS